MSMQRQPVLIPTKLEKGKDASYKAVERLRENLDIINNVNYSSTLAVISLRKTSLGNTPDLCL